MAIKLVHICDGHINAEGNEEVPGEPISPMIMPAGSRFVGKKRVMDLCEECRSTAPYTLLIELLEEFGRDVDADVRVSRATPAKQDIPEDERSQCRFCDRNDFRLQGRKMHESRSHPRELAELLTREREEKAAAVAARGDIRVPDSPAELDSFCEVCEQQLSSTQALEQHKNTRKHKNKAREKQSA